MKYRYQYWQYLLKVLLTTQLMHNIKILEMILIITFALFLFQLYFNVIVLKLV